MTQKFNLWALAGSAAIVSAAIMLLLGILGNFGIYTSGVEMMQKWHLFYSLSFAGIVAGMVEAAVVSFVLVFLFGWLYNAMS